MEIKKFKKPITQQEAFLKACSYCAYQERLQEEVRKKLQTYRLPANAIEEIISQLIEQNFLNEERFAKAYAGGKFRIKKWGRIKILKELEMRKVSKYCIKKGLEEITEEEYIKTLGEILTKKKSSLSIEKQYELNHKVAQYAIGKAYEPEMVW